MKNVQVVDGADNSTFPVYSVTEDDFRLIFAERGQDVEFAQDLVERCGSESAAGQLIMRVTRKQVKKSEVCGIHGTLFIDLPKRKKYFPRKRMSDVHVSF